MVTTTRTLFIALLIGLLAAACTNEIPSTSSGGTTPDVGEPTPDTNNGTPDVQAPDTDEPAPEPDIGGPEPDAGPATQWPSVVINEVAANGAPADWIELLNNSDETVDLAGWTVTDDDPEHVHALGATLGAGAYLLLLRDDAGGFTFGLGGSDAVNLYAPDGTQVDSTMWEGGQSATDLSWGRIPNGSGDFMTLESPTPAGPNTSNTPQECGNDAMELGEVCDGVMLDEETCESFDYASGQLGCADTCDAFDFSGCVAPSRLVVINEVTSSDDDQIELFNPGTDPVVIAGWMVTDENDDDGAKVYTIPGGGVLGSGEDRILTKDLDHLFGLGGKDKVKLWDAEGILVDMLAWPKGEAEVSYCLIPNGGDTAQPCEVATFGGPNE